MEARILDTTAYFLQLRLVLSNLQKSEDKNRKNIQFQWWQAYGKRTKTSLKSACGSICGQNRN